MSFGIKPSGLRLKGLSIMNRILRPISSESSPGTCLEDSANTLKETPGGEFRVYIVLL